MLSRETFDIWYWRVGLAELHVRSGRFAAAEKVYRHILARRPLQRTALAGLGRLLLRARRYDEAVDVWRRAVEIEPQRVGPIFQLARALHRSGQIEPAAAHYLRVLELDPLHEKALSTLEQLASRLSAPGRAGGLNGQTVARLMQQMLAPHPSSNRARANAEAIAVAIAATATASINRAPEAALTQFRAALELAPNFKVALEGAARCLELLGRAEEADVWKRGVHLPPQPPGSVSGNAPAAAVLVRSARRAYSKGRLEEVETVCQNLLAANEANEVALELLSRVHIRRREWPQAVAMLVQFEALARDSAEAIEMLGRALLHTGQFSAAARRYERLTELLPHSTAGFEMQGRIYSRTGDWSAACRVLRHAVELAPAEPRLRIAYGRALQHAGSLVEAESELQAALALNPREADALALLARGRSKSDPDTAFEYWARLAALYPRGPEPPLQMARIRLRQGRPGDARRWFRAILDLDPDHPEALSGYGHSLAAEDPAAAIGHFTDWAERHPNDITPRLQVARLYEKRHEGERAEAVYREILECDPYNYSVLTRFAQLLSRDPGRIEQSLDIWRRVEHQDPQSCLPALQRAYLLERVCRFEQAETEYRAALVRVPDEATAQIGLARLLFGQGRWDEAARLFEAVHHADPARRDVLLSFGRCLEALDLGNEALLAYEKVLSLDPTNVNAPLYRGRLLRRLGRVEQAIEAWREICAQAPQNANAWYELVFMLASAERDEEALAALDAAEAALPSSPPSWVRLGLAAQAGQFNERAIAYFERAVAAEPDAAEHPARLGQFFLRQGRIGPAFTNLLASRERAPNDVTVTRQLVDTVHILNLIEIDHLALEKAPEIADSVLVPEVLFRLIRKIADSEVVPYRPVARRIITVSASLAAGGAERQLVNLLRGLSEPRHRIDIALFCLSLAHQTHRDFLLPLIDERGIEVVTTEDVTIDDCLKHPEVARYGCLIRSFPEDMVKPIAFWLREFRHRRPQVVHAWQDATNLTAVVAALLAGVPRIVLAARSVRPDNPRRRLKRFMREGYQAVLGHPAVVLSNNSHAGAVDYADWLAVDPQSIAIVYNGIDFNQLAEGVDQFEADRIRQRLGVPPGASVIGSVFRMSEEKRPLLWVRAAAEIARGEPAAHFIVCGDGPMRNDMRDLARRLGIADRLHLPGQRAGIASWYRTMDVVMLTSRHEGLPNVLLEAQSLSVPVVASDVGGVDETLLSGVTGWTVRDADAAGLAERVLFCLRDHAWAGNARSAAPGFVRERFGIDPMVQRTLELYGL